MTEESEHYTGHLKVHKSLATSLNPERDTKDKHATRLGLPRAILATHFTKVEHVARFILAAGP
jgi:hypothetical protein